MAEETVVDLDELADPDASNEANYKWDAEFQRSIISMLLVDRQFLVQSMDLIKPSYFTNKAHRKACEVLFELYSKYKYHPSKTIVIQRIKEDLRDDKSLLYYLGEINALYDFYHPGVDAREYLTDRITFFAKVQALQSAFNTCLKKIDKAPEDEKTWQEVYQVLRVAMNTDRNFDPGLYYLNTIRERYDRMNEMENDTEVFITGIESIDSNIKGGGYMLGEMFSVMAPSGVGKSVFLTCMAALNALRGKKVVYITLELSEDRVAERFDSILSGCNIKCLYEEREEVFKFMDSMLEDQGENPIIIKFFPGKTADVNTIRAYLSQLKFHGFKPDMVVVDYIGEMKDYPGIAIHESRVRLVAELRGLANEDEKFFCATAMQPNRGAKEAQKVGRIETEHVGASWDQINPLDGFLALMQNEAEYAINLGRGSILKQRSGKANIMIYLRFDPITLKITEISKEEYKNQMTGRINKVTDEVMDKLEAVVKPVHWSPSEEEDEKGETK
jgi:replicative DNA helicase